MTETFEDGVELAKHPFKDKNNNYPHKPVRHTRGVHARILLCGSHVTAEITKQRTEMEFRLALFCGLVCLVSEDN